jgi:hypothetical protein
VLLITIQAIFAPKIQLKKKIQNICKKIIPMPIEIATRSLSLTTKGV